MYYLHAPRGCRNLCIKEFTYNVYYKQSCTQNKKEMHKTIVLDDKLMV